MQIHNAHRGCNTLERVPPVPGWGPSWLEYPQSSAVPGDAAVTETISEPEQPAVQQAISSDTDGRYDWIDPAFEQRGRTDAERIRHKASGCTSTDSWQHTFGGRYCEKCWPCTDDAMRAKEPEVTAV